MIKKIAISCVLSPLFISYYYGALKVIPDLNEGNNNDTTNVNAANTTNTTTNNNNNNVTNPETTNELKSENKKLNTKNHEQSDNDSDSEGQGDEDDDKDDENSTNLKHVKKFNECCSIYKFKKQIHSLNKQLLYSDQTIITSRLNDRITSLLENVLLNILNIISISLNGETLEFIEAKDDRNQGDNTKWIEYSRWFDGAGIQYCLNTIDTINNNASLNNSADGNDVENNTRAYCHKVLNFIFKKNHQEENNIKQCNEFINFIEIFIERVIREFEV